jgi:hypothetical protein
MSLLTRVLVILVQLTFRMLYAQIELLATQRDEFFVEFVD